MTNTIDINDKPIALIVQIDPTTQKPVEIILKTEFEIEGHKGNRDLWFRYTRLEDREHAQALVASAIKELIGD